MRKILEILNRSQKISIFLLVFYFILGMVVETLSIGLIFGLLNLILNDSYIELISKIDILNFLKELSKKEIIYYAFGAYFIIFIFRTLILIFVNYKRTKFISEVRKYFSDKLFGMYLLKPIDDHIKTNSSIFVRNLNDINKFADLMFELTGTIGEIIIFLGIIFLLFFFNPEVILTIILFGSFGLIIYFRFSKKTNTWGYQRQTNESDKQKIIQESFRSIKLIKLFKKDSWFIKKFSKANTVASQSDFKLLFLLSIHRPIFELAALLMMIGIIILLTIDEGYEFQLIPALGLYAASFYRLIPSLTKIVSGFYNYKYNHPVLDVIHKQIFEYKKNLIVDTKESFENIKIKNKIEIKNLSFSYPGENKKIFKNLNISFYKGKIAGIVGASGSGKTTLISLLMGFYKPNSGKILIDGMNIFDNMNKKFMNIGYVPQDTYLSDDTIKNNIAFATNASEIDDERVLKAIKNANLIKFLENLPLGINTRVGELGDKLSGGQKQRIGIARSLYNNPDILILDESTSSLDLENELAILSEIKKYKENRIIIIISHKQSTTMISDEVYEIINNEIVQIER